MLFYRVEDKGRHGPYINSEHTIFFADDYDCDRHNDSNHLPPVQDGAIVGTCGFASLQQFYAWFKYEISYLNMHYHVCIYEIDRREVYLGGHQAVIDDLIYAEAKPILTLKVKDAARLARRQS